MRKLWILAVVIQCVVFTGFYVTYAEAQETIQVEMLNRLKKQKMVFNPTIVEVSLGDTVNWVAKSKGHNVQFVVAPQDIKFKSKVSKDKKSIPYKKFKGINFKKLKKKLKLPVAGKVIYKFGKKRPATGTRWKGIFIKAKEGNKVYAVAKGQIVFSDWLTGYGNIIIINHGKGYMSLYGNNQSLLKQANEIVQAGDVIAIVGNSGGNKSNGVYYELRKNSKPFNPLSWTK